jgi:hypothetical protein
LLQARAALQFLGHCVNFYRRIAIGNTDRERAHNAASARSSDAVSFGVQQPTTHAPVAATLALARCSAL